MSSRELMAYVVRCVLRDRPAHKVGIPCASHCCRLSQDAVSCGPRTASSATVLRLFEPIARPRILRLGRRLTNRHRENVVVVRLNAPRRSRRQQATGQRILVDSTSAAELGLRKPGPEVRERTVGRVTAVSRHEAVESLNLLQMGPLWWSQGLLVMLPA